MVSCLLIWLACVDPSSVEATSRPVDASSDSGTTASEGAFTVLTYNVKGLPDAITNTDGASRMAQISPGLAAFDIVGVQESFDASFHDVLVGDNDHPIQDWSDDTVDGTRAYGTGLGLMIRGFREVERASFFYSECYGLLDGSSDCLASKGLQRVRVAVPGTDAYLDVYNTHHEAGGGPDDVAARASQVDEVVQAIEAQSADAAVNFIE